MKYKINEQLTVIGNRKDEALLEMLIELDERKNISSRNCICHSVTMVCQL